MNNNLPANNNNPLTPTGIFLKDKFPNATNNRKFAPMQLYNLFISWTVSDKSIEKLAEENNIRSVSIYELREIYPEIRSVYDFARKKHAEYLANKQSDLYEDIPAEAWIEDKFGNRQLSQSYVTMMRDRAAVLNRVAAYHETGTLIAQARTETLSRNLNININANADDLPELTDTLDALVRD